ncbi:MAG TPA: DNA replication/repair protein RecF [Acidimicrobiales bacterium]|nr:DNA replication/repair protein RecF [Acidimicrobiales bacterium]
MHLETLRLSDFRNYSDAELSPAPTGITLITGGNGSGKTNLLEAVAYLSTLRSFRGSPPAALVRAGCEAAVARAVVADPPRRVPIDAEIRPLGRDRVRVNGQPLRRQRDLRSTLAVTVFSPDDLALVKGGPAERRAYLDDLLVSCRPRLEAVVSEVERVIRQRNALLKSLAGRSPDENALFTLDVWDSKLGDAGTELVEARARLCSDLSPLISGAYQDLAGPAATSLSYRPSWDGALTDALASARRDDLRRGVTTIGPHRDEVELTIAGMPARTHASQGEQRTLALALRLAGHRLVRAASDQAPVLLLDDVFSELDADRSAALLEALGDGQALLTTAGSPPAGAPVAARFTAAQGKILT